MKICTKIILHKYFLHENLLDEKSKLRYTIFMPISVSISPPAEVKEVPSGLVGFLIFVFCTIILVYVTGFVVRCIVAGYHNSAAYREKSMRSGEVERRRFVTIQNSLTESEVQSPVSDSSTSDSEFPVQL